MAERPWVSIDVVRNLVTGFARALAIDLRPAWDTDLDDLAAFERCALATSRRLRTAWLHYVEIAGVCYQQMHRGESVGEVAMSLEIRLQAIAHAIADHYTKHAFQRPHRLTWEGEAADLDQFAKEHDVSG